MKKINWQVRYRLLEYDHNSLLEKMEANIGLFNKVLAPMIRKTGQDPNKYLTDFKAADFDNKDRKKYSGLRRGDLVDYSSFGLSHKNCIVVNYDFENYSQVRLQTEDGEVFPAVAQWCKIIKRWEENETNK